MPNSQQKTPAALPVPSYSPELGTRIAKVIELLGGRKRAAAAAGVSDETLANWRDGRSEPRFLGLYGMAREAGISLDWLASGRTGALQIAEDGTFSQAQAPVTHDSGYVMSDILAYVDEYTEAQGGRLSETQKMTLLTSIWDMVVNKGEALDSPAVSNVLYLAVSNK